MKKIVVTPEPVTIFTLNLYQYLNLTTETNKCKKFLQRSHVSKLWCHCLFSNLWLTCSHQESGFQRMVDKTYIFSNSGLSSYKTYLALSKGTHFAKRKKRFLKKEEQTLSKLRGSSYWKVLFTKLHMCVLLYQILSF